MNLALFAPHFACSSNPNDPTRKQPHQHPKKQPPNNHNQNKQLNLPQWLPISAAREMLLNRTMGHASVASMDAEEADRLRSLALAEAERYIKSTGAFRGSSGGNGGGFSRGSDDDSGSATPSSAFGSGGGGNGGGSSARQQQQQQRDFLLDLDLWHDQGFPVAVSVSVVACCKGVKRAHLVDARLDGGMLLELYRRVQCCQQAYCAVLCADLLLLVCLLVLACCNDAIKTTTEPSPSIPSKNQHTQKKTNKPSAATASGR
jgi:hypothetical protein